MDVRKLELAVIHAIHIPFFFVWFGLFLIPTSIWPGRIEFQFWYALILITLEYLWGLIAIGKLAPICPLTTYMQEVRGYSYHDPRNYEHSYMTEVARDFLRIPVRNRTMDLILKASFVLIILQFLVISF